MSSRQAVLLIHGIGEQRPMETLRRFVDTVWTLDEKVHHRYAGSNIWSKPDNASHSFELRRLVTPQNEAGIRTDFYEFYWAHLMQGTNYGHVFAWVRSLLWRSPRTVPAHLRGPYWVLVAAIVLAAVLASYGAITLQGDGGVPAWMSLALSVIVIPLVGLALNSIVGDAARYRRRSFPKATG